MNKIVFTLCIVLSSLMAIAQVGINTATPDQTLDVNGKVKIGDDATTPTAGTIRFNSTTNEFEGYDGSDWVSLSGGGGGGGIMNVTKAVKDTMNSAPLGTLVYQTDDYKGIYAKESDGWRSQSGDTPIFYINVGNPLGSYTGPVYTLDASHHTLYVEGNWDILPFDLFTLPAASSCKGRIYTFYVLNYQHSTTGYGVPYEENGYGVNFSGSDQYIQLDISPLASATDRGSSIIPTHRQFAIQSDGTDWREILNDKANTANFDLNTPE